MGAPYGYYIFVRMSSVDRPPSSNRQPSYGKVDVRSSDTPHLDFLDGQIEELSGAIEEQMRPFAWQVELLSTIPEVQQSTAEILIAVNPLTSSRIETSTAKLKSSDEVCKLAPKTALSIYLSRGSG